MSISSFDQRIAYIDEAIKKHQEKHGEKSDIAFIHSMLDTQDELKSRRRQLVKMTSEANLKSQELKKHPLTFLTRLWT